jgi:hypothetical protein
LLVVVLYRDVGLNALNGWTILLGLLAGTALITRPDDGRTASVAAVVLLLAILPALVGGLGLLYSPSVALALAARSQLCGSPTT